MPDKRVFPLNNPLSEKDVAVASSKKFIKPDDNDNRWRGWGGSKGGQERTRPAEALLKCLMCSRVQKMVFTHGRPPNYHRCIWCGELQPADGYRVIAYGLYLPQPLAPQELKARQQGPDI